ncbi:MAG: hypothetical protein GF307_01765 [candidate division Zixibacteria bacterium]|nr:hypothetical protein [candidate division Zixibacteria bacterium]
MLTIRCSKCKAKVFKYHKIGKGRVLRCWFDRIRHDYSIRKGDDVYCQCGNLIGVVEGKKVNMKQSAFVYSGTKSRG